MTKADLINFIRVLADDTIPARYLCPAATLNTFIDESVREASERSVSVLGSFPVVVSALGAEYTVDSSLIFINRIMPDWQEKPLIKTTKHELDYNIKDWEKDSEDKPLWYFQEGTKITIYAKPKLAGNIVIDGTIRTSDLTAIPANLHESLAYWSLYRYFSINQSNTLSPAKSAESLTLFTQAFGAKRSEEFNKSWRNGSSHSSMNKNIFR